MLYIVSTPIGNLEDITLRAIRILKKADLIVCEDTRRTGKLLARYNIDNKLLSYNDYNLLRRIPKIITRLEKGENIALVSDAGTPTISDPGYKLVRASLKKNIKIEAIPGPSAIITALSVSGLPTDKFTFLGYLPRKSSQRKKLLKKLSSVNNNISTTYVAFESPYRLLKSLEDIYKILADINIVVCSELTKMYEEVRREKLSKALVFYQKHKPKGEFTIVFNLGS